MFIFTAQFLIMNNTDFKIVDIPIEFKEINPSDFDSNFYDVSEKEIVTPNNEGYISDELQDKLLPDLYNKNTVVINAGVGQGKSYSVIKLIAQYFKQDNYLLNEKYIVILAVPFKSLIQQYYDDLIKEGISPTQIFNYLVFDEKAPAKEENKILNPFLTPSILDYAKGEFSERIHILTINGLLGNSGEHVISQNSDKLNYFNRIIKYCKKFNKKIIVFYDEIHDGIQNFTQENLVKLWRFHGLIEKNYIVSATFNEASKEVIKYLSEFTEKKIKIIESERIIKKEQSKLHLIFNDRLPHESEHLNNILREKVRKKENLDIIVYSKTQIKELFKKNKIKVLIDKEDINYCYYDIFSKESNDNKKYSLDKINIGTNFTTGVNITKEKHNYFIIIPVRSNIPFLRNKGVFTNGIISIIQSLARQREIGDIYISMPTPFYLDLDSLPYSDDIKEKISENFSSRNCLPGNMIKYSNINSEYKLLQNAYHALKNSYKLGFKNLDKTSRKGMNEIRFPKLETFILTKGESYLSENFFDGDLSTYIYWAATCNQFINCKLSSIYVDGTVFYESNKLREDITDKYYELLNTSLFKDEYFNYLSPYYLYRDLFNVVIGNKVVYLDEKKTNKRQRNEIDFYCFWICVFQNKFPLKGLSDNLREEKQKLKIHYLRSCFHHFKNIETNGETIQFENLNIEIKPKYVQILINNYKDWFEFIKILEKDIKKIQGKGKIEKIYLEKEPSEEFVKFFEVKNMEQNISELMENDPYFKNDIIPFNDTFSKAFKNNTSVNTFYDLLINICFDIQNKKIGQTRQNLIINRIDFNANNWDNIHYEFFPLFSLD